MASRSLSRESRTVSRFDQHLSGFRLQGQPTYTTGFPATDDARRPSPARDWDQPKFEAQMIPANASPDTLTAQSWEYEATVPGGIVAGVDGSKESIAALNTAAAIARSRRCPLHVVTVLQPFPSYKLNPGSDNSAESMNELRAALRDSELAQIMTALEPQTDWTHEAVVGRPARELSFAAERRGAELLVVGRHRHGAIDRVLGGETTLQIMRMSAVPVLAVDSDLESAHTVVAAVDFSPSSLRAAKAVLQLMGNSGTLYMVLVEPPAELLPNGFALPEEARLPGDAAVRFRGLADGLGKHPGILAEPVVLSGRPVSAIVQFAERVGADLITTGSHGHGKVERFLLGSVSTGLVRNASCGVLVVPPSD
jgi:nucleotide-binding universal stress UspA family protein